MSNPVNVEGTVEYVEADFADSYVALPQSRRMRVLSPLVGLMLVATSGVIPAVAGALIQEGVDLATILYALRALGRPRGGRRS